MMLDEQLRLASASSLIQNGYSYNAIGNPIDLERAGDVLDQTMGVFIRFTESLTEIGGGSGVLFCGFALVASPNATPSFLAGGTSDIILGNSEPMRGQALSTLAARALPAAGEELFFRVNTTTERAAQGDKPSPLTGTFYTATASPRYLHLGFWTFPAIPGYVGAQVAVTGGRINAWLTNSIPTIARAKRDHRSFAT